MTTPVGDPFEMLRVKIESALPTPLLLVISSARDDDGKAVVAAQLARSMEGAGYSTLLVRADSVAGSDAAVRTTSLAELAEIGFAAPVARESGSGLATLVLPAGDALRAVSRETVERFAAACRAAHAVTIVDSAVRLSSALAMLTAVTADGVLLAARRGRRVCAHDRELAKALAQHGLPFLGVVHVAPQLIAAAPSHLGVASARAKIPGAVPGLRESPST
jgi:Mrp family chromosome partitioning ATPase